ncbi:hypothetical protein VNO77_41452 [Canavalia gladiata]|uniref:Uncharacterized protein n=1 Tax=Canavalia gladiata TaxID=3824 RepID=A0AAN9K130_CANGL
MPETPRSNLVLTLMSMHRNVRTLFRFTQTRSPFNFRQINLRKMVEEAVVAIGVMLPDGSHLVYNHPRLLSWSVGCYGRLFWQAQAHIQRRQRLPWSKDQNQWVAGRSRQPWKNTGACNHNV